MLLIPAVDLLDGQIVRLVEGDFARKTIFAGRTPTQLLNGFVDHGARALHLVDLSGARDPRQRQTQLIETVVRDVNAEIQVGGGIRQLEEISELLNVGATRVVLGSLIVTDPKTTATALEKFGPSRLTFALDVRFIDDRAMVMSHGWQKATGQSFSEVITPYIEKGLKRVLCTDIALDGTMQGPNIALYRSLVEQFPQLEVQASGGVSSIGDLEKLARTGVHSTVIGRALLSGAIDFTEALRRVM